MEQETKRILEMLQVGQITQTEAARLLDALENTKAPSAPRTSPRTLRINVTDTRTGRAKVNISIPLSLVQVASKMGLTLGIKHAPELADVDFDEMFAAIKSGAEGKIVDIEDEEDRQHVVVMVE